MNRDSTTPTTGLRFPLQCSPEQEKLPGSSPELLPETEYFQTGRATMTLGFYKHEPRHSDQPGWWTASLRVLSCVNQDNYIAGAFEISLKQRQCNRSIFIWPHFWRRYRAKKIRTLWGGVFLFRLSPLSHAFLQRLLKPQWCPCLDELLWSFSSPSSRHPCLGHAPTSLFTDMAIALVSDKALMQLGYMEGGVDQQQCILSAPSQLFGSRCQGFPEWTMVGICIITAEKCDMVLVTRHEQGLWSALCS